MSAVRIRLVAEKTEENEGNHNYESLLEPMFFISFKKKKNGKGIRRELSSIL